MIPNFVPICPVTGHSLLYCTMGLCYAPVSSELRKPRKELIVFFGSFRRGLLYSWLSKNVCWRKQITRSSLRLGTTFFFFSAVYPTFSTTHRRCSLIFELKKKKNWVVRVLMKFNLVRRTSYFSHFLICRLQSQQHEDGISWWLIIKKKLKLRHNLSWFLLTPF